MTMTTGALPPEFNVCLRAASPPPFPIARCFFFRDDHSGYIPPGASDAACAACVGWRWLRDTYAQHVAGGGERMGLRAFRHLMGDNAFTARVKNVARWTTGYSNI